MGRFIASALAAVFALAANDPAAAGDQELADDADVGRARVAIYFNPFVGTVRSKGVRKITIPATGTYCVKANVPIDMRKVIPSVTVDRTYSSGANSLAQWAGSASSCPNSKRWIEVRTYQIGSTVTASGFVGFALVVQ
jgi:hypothetical protein